MSERKDVCINILIDEQQRQASKLARYEKALREIADSPFGFAIDGAVAMSIATTALGEDR